MKKTLLFILVALLFIPGFGQNDEAPKISVKLGGFIEHAMYLDTYKSIDTRDGELLLYPAKQKLDSNNNDVNKNLQFQMAALTTRFNIKADGPDIAGAKSSAYIEADFYATSQDYVYLLRLRHAFFKLKWAQIELLVGQYWHPMFVTSVAPSPIQFGAGSPFHPLNRAPQVRLTYSPGANFQLMLALISAGYHKSSGPANALRNSGIPEVQFNAEYSSGIFLAGVVAGYKVLKPRLTTDNGYKTDKVIGSFNLEAYTKLKINDFSIKLEGIYGENLTKYVMIGGYGAKQDPAVVDDYDYSNLNTYCVWTDLEYKIKSITVGTFLALSGNLGSNNDYYSLDYTRGGDLDNIYRIAPRVTKKFDKLSVSFEYSVNGAVYGDTIDEKGKVTDKNDAVIDHRFMISTKYTF